ncbi:phycocyanin subunit beta [Oxynema sp. CENA135]|jgi:phycoerythrocyanin beta chain|uniref:Phycocyanin subunit beta n=1 Tax=Oxynema aestuarii AP17 TaxID=2064643 RepID=A0A6H1TX92_9CYAN|nr:MULTISPECIES: phycocyanin/phycoerythrocyanin subunit beta [Oxynema]MBK4729172.1 phycocyanin subunit beta [Oxynema sp. CENA135]QIZ70826.1 phycocyanin subunit beta [Oxynema aestuarii AP17]RMH71552.1 MAG: phycocyanin subunit beta [Cyanobacteria bacterium J007]
MLDAFSKVVNQADKRWAYLSEDEINGLQAMVADSNKRLDVVNRLTCNASSIVSNAYRALVAEQPQVFGAGGQCDHHRNHAACIRDMGFILRYVTYAMLAGDASVLDDRCLNGLRETYQALGTPGGTVASGIQKMKDAAIGIANDPNGISKGDCSSLISELAGYFDRAASAVE